MPRVPQPTLVIRAAESETLTEEAWCHWQDLQPGATFVEIPGAGHMVPMERPMEVVEAVDDFLSKRCD